MRSTAKQPRMRVPNLAVKLDAPDGQVLFVTWLPAGWGRNFAPSGESAPR